MIVPGAAGLEVWCRMVTGGTFWGAKYQLVRRALSHQTVQSLDPEPENVLLLNNKCRTVKLIDFRLSRRAMPGTEVRKMLRTTEFLSPEAQLRGGVGLCGNV